MNQSLRHYMASTVAEEVKSEIDRSEEKYGPLHSLHEGLAVLREKSTELENEVFWRADKANTKSVRKEAIQVAAIALRIAMMVSPVPVVPLPLDLPDET